MRANATDDFVLSSILVAETNISHLILADFAPQYGFSNDRILFF
jgi:hypothetical protein